MTYFDFLQKFTSILDREKYFKNTDNFTILDMRKWILEVLDIDSIANKIQIIFYTSGEFYLKIYREQIYFYSENIKLLSGIKTYDYDYDDFKDETNFVLSNGRFLHGNILDFS